MYIHLHTYLCILRETACVVCVPVCVLLLSVSFCAYTDVHMYMYVHISKCIYIYTYLYLYISTYRFICMYINYPHIYISVYI